MNFTTAIFLISDAARAVKCIYEEGDKPKTFKTLNPDIKVDDLVVVPTESRIFHTVVKVVEVDVDVDFDDSVPMQWIIGKVDMDAHETVVKQEEEAISLVKSAEKKRKREQLRADLIADTEGLAKLPIYTA